MFDVGFLELVTVTIVALLVLGPERLPHAARLVGAAIGKLRRTLMGFKAELEHEVELEDLKKRLATHQEKVENPLQQLQDLRHELESIQKHDDTSPPTDQPSGEDNEQTTSR